MTDKQPLTVFISRGGEIRHTHSTEAAAITSDVTGARSLRRASKVEPTAELSEEAIAWLAICAPHPKPAFIVWSPSHIPFRSAINALRGSIMLHAADKWWADMLPSNGPVLGPFFTNTEALTAELAWLDRHGVPTVTDPGAIVPQAHTELEDVDDLDTWLARLHDAFPYVARWVDTYAAKLADREWLKLHFNDSRVEYRTGENNTLARLHRLRLVP